MRTAAIFRFLSLVGTSYKWASLLGFLVAGLIYPLAAALRPDSDHRLLLLFLMIGGPVAGSAVTFLARRVIDAAERLSPGFSSNFEAQFDDRAPGFEFRAALAMCGIVVGVALFALVVFGGVGHATTSPGKCTLSRMC